MQDSVREALNGLGSEVNQFTTDLGAFVKSATDEIAKLSEQVKKIPDGTADADEIAQAIAAQTARLNSAHQSLTNFTIPPIPEGATAPPIVTAPTVDPNADTVPEQPPVQSGSAPEGTTTEGAGQ